MRRRGRIREISSVHNWHRQAEIKWRRRIGFAVWAQRYRDQLRARMRIGKLNEHVVAFTAAVPALGTAILFAFAMHRDPEQLPAGEFLAVYAISMTFFVAIARFGQSLEAIAAIIPGVEEVRPILHALPEKVPVDAPAVELIGDIQLDRVSFQYSDDGPFVLQDVSIHARRGEFVAIVGESASGKSSLLRGRVGSAGSVRRRCLL